MSDARLSCIWALRMLEDKAENPTGILSKKMSMGISAGAMFVKQIKSQQRPLELH